MKLEKPDSINLQKLVIGLWIRLGAQISTKKKRQNKIKVWCKSGRQESEDLYETHMIVRSPRDLRKLKLAESGKPDLKTPLSTMAKFKGGTNSSSPSVALSPPISGGGETLIGAQMSSSNAPTFMSFSRQKCLNGGRRNKKAKSWRGMFRGEKKGNCLSKNGKRHLNTESAKDLTLLFMKFF